MNDFDDPNSAVNLLVGKGFVAGAMTRWVSGGWVYGNNRRGLFLDRLQAPPSEIWEIRATEPVFKRAYSGVLLNPTRLF
jgi:hypothetical protein